MFWPVVGLKKKIKRLEAEIVSLNEQVKELKFSEQSLVELCNKKHEMIIELGDELIGVRKTSAIADVPPESPRKPAFSFGQEIARRLRGGVNVDRNNR